MRFRKIAICIPRTYRIEKFNVVSIKNTKKNIFRDCKEYKMEAAMEAYKTRLCPAEAFEYRSEFKRPIKM